jgi:hypothetical protein
MAARSPTSKQNGGWPMPLEGFDDAELPPRDQKRRSGPGSGAKIDLGVVERAASIGCSKEEVAAVLGIHRDTLHEHIARNPEIQEALDHGGSKGRATLRRLQWKGAEDGNATMLVWLGKQLLGQKDSIAHTGGDGGPITIITGVDRGD